MSRSTSEETIELAIALLSGEPMAFDQARTLARMSGDPLAAHELRETVELLRGVHTALGVARTPAVDDETVAAYADGSCTGNRRIAVEEAIAGNPESVEELVELVRLIHGEENPRMPLWEFVVGVVSDGFKMLLYPGEGYTALDTAPALLSQNDALTPTFKTHSWSQRYQDLSLQFRLIQVTGMREHFHFLILVTGDTCRIEGRAALYREADLLECISLSSSGTATFTNLAPAAYDIEIDLPPVERIAFRLNLVDLSMAL